MNVRAIRRLALALIALLAFAQVSVALAACSMDRGTLAQAVAMPADSPCTDCGPIVTDYDPLHANRCVAHCTADLQLAGLPIANVRAACDAPVLLVPRAEPPPDIRFTAEPLQLPRRVLLHSYLI
jgi:hypothetical protein